jgi:hypothetical protein
VARPKKPATPSDMLRSLLVILIPILIISFVFTRLPDDHPVDVVDWRPVLTRARAEAPYPVLAPTSLPQEWRPTRVTWVKKGAPYLNGEVSVRNVWELGFLNPDDTYVALSQGDLEADDFVKDRSREGGVDGESRVAGQTWSRLVSPDDRTRSLVLSQPEVTTVVSGDVAYEALEAFAATLSTTG